MAYTQLSTIAVPGMRYHFIAKRGPRDLNTLTIDDLSDKRTIRKIFEDVRTIDNLSDVRTMKI